MTISKDFSNLILTIKFEANAPTIFSLRDSSDLIRDQLALHGAIQMTAAKANGSKECEWAYRNSEDTIAYIYEEYPASPSIKTPRNLIIEALARIKNYSIQQTTESWNMLSQEKRKELATKSTVINMVTVIRGKREEFWLNQMYNEVDAPRRKHYEHTFDLDNRKAHMRFINGSQLDIDLALVKDVNALALYGAEQKIRDSYSGIKNDQDKMAQAERVIRNLVTGNWSSKKEATGKDADYSVLDTQVANQLVEWMRWPLHATMIAVSQTDEEYKLRLISAQAKVLLCKAAQRLYPSKDPSKYSQREISDLLDEVINLII